MSLFNFFKNRRTELEKELAQYKQANVSLNKSLLHLSNENDDLRQRVNTLSEKVMQQSNIIDGYKRKEPNRDPFTGKFISKPVVS